MELNNIKINIFFLSESSTMMNFSFYLGIQRTSLSSHKKIEKIREIKFGTKIEFQKTKGTDYLIAKKIGD
jgi:hypothetical protein